MSDPLRNGGGLSFHIAFVKIFAWSSLLFREQSLLLFVFWIAVFAVSSGFDVPSFVKLVRALRRCLLPPPPLSAEYRGVAASKRARSVGGGLQEKRPFSMHS